MHPKIDEVKELVERLGGKLSLLVEHGFKQIDPLTSHSCPCIYVHEEYGLVVKRPYTTVHERAVPSFAIPTVIIDLPLPPDQHRGEYGWSSETLFRQVFIQPLADLTNKKQARIDILAIPESNNYSDLREDNVGYYNGVAVAFDWQ